MKLFLRVGFDLRVLCTPQDRLYLVRNVTMTCDKIIIIVIIMARAKAHGLRALAAFAENQSSISNTHLEAPNSL